MGFIVTCVIFLISLQIINHCNQIELSPEEDHENYKITRSQSGEDYKIMIPKMKKDQEVQEIQEMESGDSQEEIEEILSQVNNYLVYIQV